MKARRKKEGKAEQRRRTAWRTAWQGAVARLSSNNHEKPARKRREVAEAVATTIDTREGDLAWQGAGRERAIHNNNKRASQRVRERERKRAGKREQKRGNICKVAAELRVPYSEFFVDLFAPLSRFSRSLPCLSRVPRRRSQPHQPTTTMLSTVRRLASTRSVATCARRTFSSGPVVRDALRQRKRARERLCSCCVPISERRTPLAGAMCRLASDACASAASLANSCSRCLHVLRRP